MTGFVSGQPECGHLRHLRYASQGQFDVLDGQRLGQTQDQLATQKGAGSLFLVAAKDDVVIIQPEDLLVYNIVGQDAGNLCASIPDVEAFCASAVPGPT